MRFFFRYVIPATYFESTRIPTVALKIYNGLVEWLPALVFSLYFNEYSTKVIVTVILSYVAFICVYEIGYLTNDYYSELFEDEPRGRGAALADQGPAVHALITVRIIIFLCCTFLLGVSDSVLWWTFHGTLAATFALHNLLPNEMRIGTFFGLSAYRFLGPMIVTLRPEVLSVLVPAAFLNHSLYRTTVYLRGKNTNNKTANASVTPKFGFYAGCLPFSALLSYFYGSFIPLGLCLYFGFVWILYLAASTLTGWKPGPGSQ